MLGSKVSFSYLYPLSVADCALVEALQKLLEEANYNTIKQKSYIMHLKLACHPPAQLRYYDMRWPELQHGQPVAGRQF